MKSFNTLYYNKQFSRVVDGLTHYEPFFYPLDAILDWNKMYGARGFFQYQFVVPFEQDRSIIKEIFARITASKRASFLAVLKTFGGVTSPGLLSFPRKGVTLALDFPNDGAPTLQLMSELDSIVFQAGGCLYPAKDARMSPLSFAASYPRLKEFTKYIDPGFSSSLWRRSRRPRASARRRSNCTPGAMRKVRWMTVERNWRGSRRGRSRRARRGCCAMPATGCPTTRSGRSR
jgi:hypothetical protein